VAELQWATRAAELAVLAAGSAVGDRAVRELLALQSSDWAFLVTRQTAGDYPRERFDGHAAALRAALDDPHADPRLRNLAPHLARAALLEP
jgi:1,4-alpha-glucan branching enzyme